MITAWLLVGRIWIGALLKMARMARWYAELAIFTA